MNESTNKPKIKSCPGNGKRSVKKMAKSYLLDLLVEKSVTVMTDDEVMLIADEAKHETRSLRGQ